MQPITTQEFEMLINQFASSTGLGFVMAMPLTLLLVALLKRIPILATIKSEWLAFGVALAFQGVLLLGAATDSPIPFTTWFERLNAIVPLAVGIIATLGFSSWAYELTKRYGWPVVGYQRPDAPVDTAVG